MNIIETSAFYTTPLGKATREVLAARLAPALKAAPDQLVLGLGYATPYLGEEARHIAMMMARGGVLSWPETGANKAALVDELNLPLPDNSVDVALLVHALELSESAEDLAAEIWRVLTPQGRLVMLVPNRRGLWASYDGTPFGQGQPFSWSQLQELLREAQFAGVRISQALAAPPWAGAKALGAVEPLARVGFGGVFLVEAIKQVHALVKSRKVRRVFAPLQPMLLPGVRPVARS